MIVDTYFWWGLLKVCCFLGVLGISVWVVYRLMAWNSERTILILGGVMAFGLLISAANLTAKIDRAVAWEATHD